MRNIPSNSILHFRKPFSKYTLSEISQGHSTHITTGAELGTVLIAASFHSHVTCRRNSPTLVNFSTACTSPTHVLQALFSPPLHSPLGIPWFILLRYLSYVLYVESNETTKIGYGLETNVQGNGRGLCKVHFPLRR